MTLPRAIITVGMAAAFGHYAGDVGNHLVVAFVAWPAWSFTTDPLPGAIERGLDAYREKHQR